ncbi:MAG TPA: glutamate--tRNA ligase, partial [Microbacteriaceae bacterium]|nr:glutamate--tRNA ligase [Microbacteriaceae bacterium]
RDRGFIPEGLLNYLSLLGWSLTHDRDVFTMDEMVAAFDVTDVNPNPARFDLKKAESINGDQIRLLPVEEFTARLIPYLGEYLADPPTGEQEAILREAAPLVQERMQLLGEAPGLLGFLFTADDALEYDADALPGAEADIILDAAVGALEQLNDWSHEEIERVLRAELIDGAGLKPRVAFGALRTAISGRRISPPLFESMEIIGKESTMARIARLAARL